MMNLATSYFMQGTLGPLVVAMGLDPLRLPYEIMLELDQDQSRPFHVTTGLVYFCRLTIQSVLHMGACRNVGFVVMLAFSGIKLLKRHLDLLNSKGSLLSFKKFGRLYNHYYLTVAVRETLILAPIILGTLAFGIVVEILTVFATIRMTNVAKDSSLMIYVVFPFAAVLTAHLFHVAIPDVVAILETSQSLLNGWKRKMEVVPDKKYVRRKLRGMRLAKLSAGIASYTFFSFDNSTKAAVFWVVMDYVVTALLSIP
jgi:hypothetical protein